MTRTMNKHRTFQALGATLALGIASFAMITAPAQAATTCSRVNHTTTAGILTTSDGEAVTATNQPSNGTATMTADGVAARTPDALSKVQWIVPAPTNTRLADVDGLRLRMRNDVTGSNTVSYQLQIDPSPNNSSTGTVHFTTLVWEAGNNGYGAISGFRTYSLDPAGPEGWWSTRVLPAVAGTGTSSPTHAPFRLGTYLAAYPDATVLAYGWDLGKGSPGLKTTVSALRFSTTGAGGCVISSWALPVAPPAYTGFAVRRSPLIEGRNWDHNNTGWIQPFHSTFEAELVADYDHVAPADTAARTMQVAALAHRNASHTNGHHGPGQPLIFVPATLG